MSNVLLLMFLFSASSLNALAVPSGRVVLSDGTSFPASVAAESPSPAPDGSPVPGASPALVALSETDAANLQLVAQIGLWLCGAVLALPVVLLVRP